MPDLNPQAVQDRMVGGRNDTSMMPPQNMPVQASLTPPAQPAPQQQPTLQPGQMASAAGASAQPAKPGSFFHNLSHAMVGSVLGALAGDKDTTGYSVDETGKMTPLTRPMSTVDKLRKIAANALVGLAAGAQTPEGKSGLASGLSGLGAGAGAVQQKAEQKDTKLRGQANEDFERQQKAALQKMEMMKGNAILLGLHYNNVRSQNELDPEVTTGKADWEQVQKVPELANHATVVTGEQLADLHKKDAEGDSHFDNTHIILKLGSAPELDENGNPIKGADGEIKNVSRFAIINGAQAMKDSPKAGMPISAEMANDIHRFGSLGPTPIPGAENIKAGDAIPLDQWVVLRNNILESKKNVMQGWQNSKIAFQTGPDGKEVMGEINPNLPAGDPERFRPFGATVPASAEDEKNKIAEGAEKTKLTKAQTAEAQAKAQEAIGNLALARQALQNNNNAGAQAALEDAISKTPDPAKTRAVLRSYSYDVPTMQAILGYANYDTERSIFPARVSKGTLQVDATHIDGIARMINPGMLSGGAQLKRELAHDYLMGDKSKAIGSFGQFLSHAAQAQDAAVALGASNSSWLNTPVNKLRSNLAGDKRVTDLIENLFAVKSEFDSFIHSGHVPSKEEVETLDRAIDENKSPNMILSAIKQMGEQAVGRLDQLNQPWRNLTGKDYPNLIDPAAKDAATHLGLASIVQKFGSGGVLPGVNPPGSQIPQPPDGAKGHTLAADGVTTVYQMPDGSIQDATGKKYDPTTGKPMGQ